MKLNHHILNCVKAILFLTSILISCMVFTNQLGIIPSHLTFIVQPCFSFKTLRTLCQLTRTNIQHSLETFLQNEFVQPQLISQELLKIQMGSLLADFVDSAPKTFLKTLRFIQDMTAQSLFMTGASVTSVLPTIQFLQDESESVPYSGKNHTLADGSSCTCSSSTATTCMGPATLHNEVVPGFLTGCYMLSALLQSTLEAFSNQTFINILTNSTNKYRKLNSSLSNATVETLLSQMFITDWSNKTLFEQYFYHCSPDSCEYTVTEHYDFLFILTSLIGLFGGLSSIMRNIIPFIVMRIWPKVWWFVTRRKTSVTQLIQAEVNPGNFTFYLIHHYSVNIFSFRILY